MLSFAVGLPVISVVTIYLVRVMELRTRRNTVPGTIRETLTLRLFLAAGALMLTGSLVEYFWRGEGMRLWPFLAGWACALASFLIRWRAIAALGRFWSLHVEIRANHEFVQSGPFRWMRHPTYFSMILELLLVGLILNVYYSLLAVSLLFVPTLLRRIRLEEAMLVEKFGEAYRNYQATTPALFPYKLIPSK